MTDTGALREEFADELGGWPLGSGYYQYTVSGDDAQEMADRLLALPALRDLIARADAQKAYGDGYEQGRFDERMDIATGRIESPKPLAVAPTVIDESGEQ